MNPKNQKVKLGSSIPYIYIYKFKTLIIFESYYYTHTQILLQKACC